MLEDFNLSAPRLAGLLPIRQTLKSINCVQKRRLFLQIKNNELRDELRPFPHVLLSSFPFTHSST
jgi:hypothetical protein